MNIKKSATVVGYHGYGNFGDDIFLSIICHWLRTKFGVEKIRVASTSPDNGRLAWVSSIEILRKPLASIERSIWIPIFVSALKSNFLVFSAGSIFTIQPFFLMFLAIKTLKLVRGKQLRIYSIGVSIGPFSSSFDRYWCLKCLSLMDRVVLRDKQSYELVRNSDASINAISSHDLAILKSAHDVESGGAEEKILGVSLTQRAISRCSEAGHSRSCDEVVQFISFFRHHYHNGRVRVFDLCEDQDDGDQEICTHIVSRVEEVCGDLLETYSYQSGKIDNTISKIAECNALLASRMHAGVMAIRESVPVFQLSYADKISQFYDSCGLKKDWLFRCDQPLTAKHEDFIIRAMEGDLAFYAAEQREKMELLSSQVKKTLYSVE